MYNKQNPTYVERVPPKDTRETLGRHGLTAILINREIKYSIYTPNKEQNCI